MGSMVVTASESSGMSSISTSPGRHIRYPMMYPVSMPAKIIVRVAPVSVTISTPSSMTSPPTGTTPAPSSTARRISRNRMATKIGSLSGRITWDTVLAQYPIRAANTAVPRPRAMDAASIMESPPWFSSGFWQICQKRFLYRYDVDS